MHAQLPEIQSLAIGSSLRVEFATRMEAPENQSSNNTNNADAEVSNMHFTLVP